MNHVTYVIAIFVEQSEFPSYRSLMNTFTGIGGRKNTENHQENMSVKCIPPNTPLLCSKTGVCRGIPIFLIFAPKHRMWVLVRGGSNVYPQSMF